MPKYSKTQNLPKEKEEELLLELCEALVVIKEATEAAHFLKDLLSSQELRMIAKRLRIARLLLQDIPYHAIEKQLSTSPTTIARVNTWLQGSGEGYRLVIERTKEKPLTRAEREAPRPSHSSWTAFKRSHPLYFWPEILLEELLFGAKKEQLRKLRSALTTLKKSNKKTYLFHNIDRALRTIEHRENAKISLS